MSRRREHSSPSGVIRRADVGRLPARAMELLRVVRFRGRVSLEDACDYLGLRPAQGREYAVLLSERGLVILEPGAVLSVALRPRNGS